jgi:hypothetical protein
MHSKLWWGGLGVFCLVQGIAPIAPTRPAIANPTLTSLQAQAQNLPQTAASSPISNQLTEENIRNVLALMQSAQNKENLEDLLKYVAPFVSSEITINGDSGSTTIILDGIEKHRALLKDLFALIKSREVLSQKVKIRLSDDNTVGIATIYTVKAIKTEDGKNIIASDVDTLRFAWLNNQPTVVSLQSKGWFSEAPASK